MQILWSAPANMEENAAADGRSTSELGGMPKQPTTHEIEFEESMKRAVKAQEGDERKVADMVRGQERPGTEAANPGSAARPAADPTHRRIVALMLIPPLIAGILSGMPAWGGDFEAAPTTIRDILPNSDSGVVSEVRLAEVLVRSQHGGQEVRYLDSAATVYLDEAGATMPRAAIAVGMRVTVHFTATAGGGKRVDRMVIDRRTGGKTIAPTVVGEPVG